eukprot:3210137-Prymnesium_polylepis.1
MHVLGGGTVSDGGDRVYPGDHVVLNLDTMAWHAEPSPADWAYMAHSKVHLARCPPPRPTAAPSAVEAELELALASTTLGDGPLPSAGDHERCGGAFAVYGGMTSAHGVPPNLPFNIPAGMQFEIPSATNALWLYDLRQREWRTLDGNGAAPTRGLFRHSATIVGAARELMAIFGGFS